MVRITAAITIKANTPHKRDFKEDSLVPASFAKAETKVLGRGLALATAVLVPV